MPWRRERLPTPEFWPGVAKNRTWHSDFHFTPLNSLLLCPLLCPLTSVLFFWDWTWGSSSITPLSLWGRWLSGPILTVTSTDGRARLSFCRLWASGFSLTRDLGESPLLSCCQEKSCGDRFFWSSRFLYAGGCVDEGPTYRLGIHRWSTTSQFLVLITSVGTGQGAPSFLDPFQKLAGWCLKRHMQGGWTSNLCLFLFLSLSCPSS